MAVDTPLSRLRPLYKKLRGVLMLTLQDYINRLVKVGYSQGEAEKVVMLYDRQRDLDGLESYIACKESLEAVD